MLKLGNQWFDNIRTIQLGQGDANNQPLPQGDMVNVDPVHAYSLNYKVPGKRTLQSDAKKEQSEAYTIYFSVLVYWVDCPEHG
jgi:hypothetical protein